MPVGVDFLRWKAQDVFDLVSPFEPASGPPPFITQHINEQFTFVVLNDPTHPLNGQPATWDNLNAFLTTTTAVQFHLHHLHHHHPPLPFLANPFPPILTAPMQESTPAHVLPLSDVLDATTFEPSPLLVDPHEKIGSPDITVQIPSLFAPLQPFSDFLSASDLVVGDAEEGGASDECGGGACAQALEMEEEAEDEYAKMRHFMLANEGNDLMNVRRPFSVNPPDQDDSELTDMALAFISDAAPPCQNAAAAGGGISAGGGGGVHAAAAGGGAAAGDAKMVLDPRPPTTTFPPISPSLFSSDPRASVFLGSHAYPTLLTHSSLSLHQSAATVTPDRLPMPCSSGNELFSFPTLDRCVSCSSLVSLDLQDCVIPESHPRLRPPLSKNTSPQRHSFLEKETCQISDTHTAHTLTRRCFHTHIASLQELPGSTRVLQSVFQSLETPQPPPVRRLIHV
eukprot:m.88049 g.88049  ORF g.88049 m.88049 type:complete len:453 (-) comp13608_c0_seq3:28-1386(-)